MKNDIDNRHIEFDLLVDFAEGLIDKKNSKWITEHLSGCEQCTRVYEGIQYIYNKRGRDREALNRYLSESRLEVDKKIIHKSTHTSDTLRYFSLRAAAVILIAVVGYAVYLMTFGEPDVDTLIAGYAGEIYPPPPVVRSGDEAIDARWERASGFYSLGGYDKAIPELESIVEADDTDTAGRFYLAMCYFYTDSPERAANLFSHLSDEAHRFTQQSQWFLALTYYQAGEIERAKEVFRLIAEDDGHYRQGEATELVKGMSY